MSTGLIGFTGFVGSNLLNSFDFKFKFNTKNINYLDQHSFDLLVCSAAPGSMFEANAKPHDDFMNIKSLINHLRKVKTKKFILISTIAVYESFNSKSDENSCEFQKHIPYGLNRRFLESFCLEFFANCYIIRLPALIGQKLKKNLIFDILNPIPSFLSSENFSYAVNSNKGNLNGFLNNFYTYDEHIKMFRLNRVLLNKHINKKEIEEYFFHLNISSITFHNKNSFFQFYDLSNLWNDVKIIINNKINVMNLVTEPLKVNKIFKTLTNKNFPETKAKVHEENVRTINAKIWNNHDFYVLKSSTVLKQLKNFFLRERI